jgi:DNA-binding XRE family transcriptional regulator
MKLIEKPLKEITKGMPDFGDRFEYVRCILGFPVGAFATKLGTTKASITNVILKKTLPNMGLIETLLAVFPVNKEWLYLGNGDVFTTNNIDAYKHGNKESINPVDLDVAERMKVVRTDNNLSQTLFASDLGVTKDIITFIELGRSGINIPLMKRIVKKYNVSEQWFLWGVGKKYKG